MMKNVLLLIMLVCLQDISSQVIEIKKFKYTKSVINEYPSNIWNDIILKYEESIENNIIKSDTNDYGLMPMIGFNYKNLVFIKNDINYCKKKYYESLQRENDRYIWSPEIEVSPYYFERFNDLMHVEYEDGLYQMYYSPYFNQVENKWIIDKVFGLFNIENNKLNGEAFFFYPNGDTIAKGSYYKNKKNGTWRFNIPFSKKYKYFQPWRNTSRTFCSYNIEYKDGIINGEFSYFEGDTLRASGTIYNGIPINNWTVYHSNGQVSNKFSLSQEPYYIKKNVVLKRFDNKDYTLPFGITKLYIPGLDLTPKGKMIYMYKDKNGKRFTNFDGDFISYYKNGQLMAHWKFENGNIIEGDTVYFDNGNIKFRWDLQKKLKKGKLYTYKYDGTLYNVRKIKRRDGF